MKNKIQEEIEEEFAAAGIPVADWKDYSRKIVRYCSWWLSAINEDELQVADPEDVAKLMEHARRVANLRRN